MASFELSTATESSQENDRESLLKYYETNPIIKAINDIKHIMKLGYDGNPRNSTDNNDCIIFDMDGTLIDNIPSKALGFPENPYFTSMPIARPGMKDILHYAFENFAYVSIWTATSDVWFRTVNRELFEPNMPPGKSFHFVKTRTRAVVPFNRISLKPLDEIYRTYTEYTGSNTIIVDDNPETFKNNINNALHVPSFFYDLMGGTKEERQQNVKSDTVLFELITTLKKKKPSFYKNVLLATLSILGKINGDMKKYSFIETVFVLYKDFDLDELKICEIKKLLLFISPTINVFSDINSGEHTLFVSFSIMDIDPIVFNKVIFPEHVDETYLV